jgi:hypothetical protein
MSKSGSAESELKQKLSCEQSPPSHRRYRERPSRQPAHRMPRPGSAKAPQLWLDRYERVRPIRARAGFHVVSAVRARDREMCVVICPGAEADDDHVAEAFAEIERCHALLDHALIPKVSARGVANGRPYLELACDAVADGVSVRRLFAEARQGVTLESLKGLFSGLGDAMRAAHAVVDPRTGRPLCLGRLSHGNLLFAESGRVFLVGYGRNFPVERDDGQPDSEVIPFQAPEIALGGFPSPSADRFALFQLMLSFLPIVDVERLAAERPHAVDLGTFERSWSLDDGVLAAPAAPCGAGADASRERATGPGEPVASGFTSCLAGLLEHAAPLLGGEARMLGQPSVTLGLEVSYIVTSDGVQHPLGHAHWRIVTALVERHRTAPGATLTIQDLVEAGWPGERPIAEAGANRVYVALTHLRRMGMRDVIERCTDGYRIAAHASIRLSVRGGPQSPA